MPKSPSPIIALILTACLLGESVRAFAGPPVSLPINVVKRMELTEQAFCPRLLSATGLNAFSHRRVKTTFLTVFRAEKMAMVFLAPNIKPIGENSGLMFWAFLACVLVLMASYIVSGALQKRVKTQSRRTTDSWFESPDKSPPARAYRSRNSEDAPELSLNDLWEKFDAQTAALLQYCERMGLSRANLPNDDRKKLIRLIERIKRTMANLERPFENVPVLDPVTEKKASNALFQFLEGFTHFLDETQRKLASPRPNGPLLVTWEDLLQQEISSSDEEWPIDNWFYPMRPFAQVLEMDYLLQHPADALIKVWRPNEAKYDLVEVFLVWVGLLVGTIKIYGNNRETAYVWTQSAA